MNKLKIFADGGCRGNQSTTNIGAYAYIVLDENDNVLKEDSVAYQDTTNNKMELLGVIKGIEYVNEAFPGQSFVLEITSDSSYVCDTFNKGWINNWMKNNWLTAKKQPVKNKELWIRLLEISKHHSLNFKWTKGHANNEWNNRCDNNLNVAMNDFKDIIPSMPKVAPPTCRPNIITSNTSHVENDIDILNKLKNMRKELDELICMYEKKIGR